MPDTASAEAKTKKIKMSRVILLVTVYTMIVFLSGFYLLNVTPLADILMPGELVLSGQELEHIKELDKKIKLLTVELEKLKSTNEKLKFAIMLGDSSLLDSVQRVSDSSETKDSKLDGNLLKVVILFFDRLMQELKSQDFIPPSEGFISKKFDPGSGHTGIDIVVKDGSPVYSSAGGYVLFADYTVNYGYIMIISHPDDYVTIYKHLSSVLKKERDEVYQGELIALSGNTGKFTTGPHLHFEIWQNGKPLDPEILLSNKLQEVKN